MKAITRGREQDLLAKAKEYAAHIARLQELDDERKRLDTQLMNGHNERRKLEAQLYDFVGENQKTRYVVVGSKVVAITFGPEDGRVRIYDCVAG